MLDQNTDRMWYVIGAIIIGGLILTSSIVLFTDVAFASVQDSFNIFNQITVKDRELIGTWSFELSGGQEVLSDGGIRDHNGTSWGPEFARHVDLAPLVESYGLDKEYELIIEAKSKDTSKFNLMSVYNQNGSATRYSFGYKSIEVTEEFQTYHLKNLEFKESDLSETESHLAFYGKYDTGNIPVVRNVRLYVVKDGDN